MSINNLVKAAHDNAVDKGFWDDGVEFGTLIALVHSELSEALEADRNGNFRGMVEELADVCIRVFDLCGHYGINLELAILEKMTKNKLRPHKHGKKY